MKLRIVLGVIVVAAVVYCSLPYYARQALIHWMPVIDDLETFHRHTVRHDPDRVWNWPLLSASGTGRTLSGQPAYGCLSGDPS